MNNSEKKISLIREINKNIKNKDQLKIAKKIKDSEFIGILENIGLLTDIRKCLKFYPPSSFYGHRIGKNIVAMHNVRPKEGYDLLRTDSKGILLNSLDSESTIDRIKKAKEKKQRIIYFFGGSTMEGTGSRMPNFTIPALVEKLLDIDHDQKVCCVNFGLGGTCSQDALNILIYDAIKLANPDDVVFYDGWNCCSYITLSNNTRFNMNNNSLLSKGELLRHLEHNFALSNSYKTSFFIKRAIKLSIAEIFAIFDYIFNNRFIRRSLNFIQRNLFDIRIFKDTEKILDNYDDSYSVLNSIPESVEDYIRIHEVASEFCYSRKIRFYTFFQPLVFYGKKPLTTEEEYFKESCFASADSSIFYKFKSILDSKKYKFKMKNSKFFDFTHIFDNTFEQLYIDSGHLNRLGNFKVAEKIAEKLKL